MPQEKKLKQAIVFIHGIGEQKPMDNVREFVKAVLPPAKPGEEQYWSLPDTISEVMELRRLRGLGEITTDFYEYYWAYHVEGTKLWHLGAWLWSLVRRPGKDVPAASKTLWIITRVIFLLFVLLVVLGWLKGVNDWFKSIPMFKLGWFTVVAVLAAFQYFLIYFLGDAARYLSSHPRNITLRNAIRTDGIRLLRALHDPARGYDRIIVVGHSLGSVIGYDVLALLWQEYNEIYREPKPHDQPAMKAVAAAGHAFEGADSEKTLQEFRTRQHDLWLEQRTLGNPWLISDFVTLGSPLTHAQLLLAKSKEDFEQRIRQREFPTCPPVTNAGQAYTQSQKQTYEKDGQKFSLFTLHHAAPFAVTRWTNLYFPAKFGLFGDFVGGPVRQDFGAGIQDLPVTTRTGHGWARFTLYAHLLYWTTEPTVSDGGKTNSGLQSALQALITALDLEELLKRNIETENEETNPSEKIT
jgi:hypothetical protein